LPTTDCGGEALSTGHDTTRGKSEEPREGFIMLKMTQTSLLIIFDIQIIFLSPDFKENQLMRKDGS
jgi:hypothetical protein